MPGSANLNTMIKAARIAGRSLVKDFREVENLQVPAKGQETLYQRQILQPRALLEKSYPKRDPHMVG